MQLEHPILFSSWSMERILAGHKVETRRIVRPRFKHISGTLAVGRRPLNTKGRPAPAPAPSVAVAMRPDGTISKVPCPYGMTGDCLWVRESWRVLSVYDEIAPLRLPMEAAVEYRDGSWQERRVGRAYAVDPYPTTVPMGRWRPSMHMPRWASRLTLHVIHTRVERLHDITPSGILCEGIDATGLESVAPLRTWRELWDSINGTRKGAAWRHNPLVWVVRFTR